MGLTEVVVCCPLQKILAGPVNSYSAYKRAPPNSLPVRGRGGRPHRGLCVCTHVYTPLVCAINPAPLSSLPFLLTLPPLPYLLYNAFSSSLILLPLHSLSLPDLHLFLHFHLSPLCFVSLLTHPPFPLPIPPPSSSSLPVA